MTIIAFPGQGAQKPGFLEPWLATDAAHARVAELSEAAGVDLVRHGTESDADTIRDTAIAQPLLMAAGVLTWDALLTAGAPLDRVAVAGHSVGEVAAAYAAGIFDAASAMRFVARRATLMAQAASAAPSGMAAVLARDEDAVLARLAELDLEPANFNGAGQIVAAGAPEALDELRNAPPAGARVIPLQVAGAFHTRYMTAARDALAAELDGFAPRDPQLRIYTNADGSTVSSGRDYLRLLADQVNRPVRWDRCMAAFAAAGHATLIEAAPAGTLVGLAKRGMMGATGVAVNSPADLPAALDALQTTFEQKGAAE